MYTDEYGTWLTWLEFVFLSQPKVEPKAEPETVQPAFSPEVQSNFWEENNA